MKILKYILCSLLIATPVLADGTIDTLSAGGAITGTESMPMFQTGNPAVNTTPNALDTYLSQTTKALTNKTINCASNTCTVRIGTDVSGLGTAVATFLATPTSVNLAAAITNETGSGALVFGTAPSIAGGALSGTFSGNPTFSGVPVFTGLSAGTIAAGKNLGLDSGNNLVTATVSGGGSGANPTATAADVAVNGVAATFMRSDGAPAVQKGSSSQFGIVKVDGSTITESGGVISSVSGGAGTVTSVTLGAGLAKVRGTQNTGSDAITVTGTINLQLFPVTKTINYTVLAADVGNLLQAGGVGTITFTLPTATSSTGVAGSTGQSYYFGDGTLHGYSLTVGGGSIGGNGVTAGSTIALSVGSTASCTSDGTNWNCAFGHGIQPVLGGGTGVAALGTGIVTALGVNVGSAGAPVLFNGAGGTPSSLTLSSATGLPIATGISGLGTGVATAAAANLSANGGLTKTIFSGAKALATGAISSAACTSAQTDTATGTLTTDVVLASFNGDPTAVTGYVPLTAGMLTIIAYPTADTVNFKVCNNTSGSITPGAITLNWRVVR